LQKRFCRAIGKRWRRNRFSFYSPRAYRSRSILERSIRRCIAVRQPFTCTFNCTQTINPLKPIFLNIIFKNNRLLNIIFKQSFTCTFNCRQTINPLKLYFLIQKLKKKTKTFSKNRKHLLGIFKSWKTYWCFSNHYPTYLNVNLN